MDHKKISWVNKKGTSIKAKLTISYILLAAIPLLIVNIISTNGFKKNLSNTSMQLTTEMVKQTNTNIDYYTDDVEKNVNKFIMNNLNGATESLINNYEQAESPMDVANSLVAIKQQLVGISVYEENIEGAIIITEKGDVIGASGLLSDEGVETIQALEDSNSVWYRDTAINKQVLYIKSVKNTVTGKNFGTIVCIVKLKPLEEEINGIELFEGGRIYVIDEKSNMLCSTKEGDIKPNVQAFISQEMEVDSNIIDKEMIAYATSNCGWKIVVELSEESLTSSISDLSRIVWLMVIGVGIIGVLAGYFISKGVTNSIGELVRAMKQTEQGDLTVQVPVKGRDEMAILCRSFNNMILNIKDVIKQTHEAIDVSLESGNTLSDSTRQSVETFEQLATSISEIARGSGVQAEEAQNSVAVMNRLSASIQRVRSNTQTLFESTQSTRSNVDKATESIEILNSTMASSIEVSQKIKESINQLSNMTKSIAQIMGLVDGISEQTNLLALNASIEAARAGEVGKGFAVVANEVRKLAEQSKQSTDDVRATLSDIEEQSKSAAMLVADASKIFRAQEVAVEGAYSAFKEIIQMLVCMDSELEHINSQVIDMETDKEFVGSSIADITTVTEGNASATEEVNALSEEQKEVMKKLFKMAEHLVEIMAQLDVSIKQFKI
ncbi:MAG: methyl-accepting chemotaxis protein [Cellulosilyticum sp.]|nr:methyl-accepting chemotaxis protein [Cellulosilyticum sp.]